MAREARLQHRLRECREKAALAETERRLAELRTGGALGADAVPEWVGEAVGRTRNIFTEPYDRLPDDTPSARLDAWIEELLVAHGVTDRVFVASHLRILPWLECRVPAHGWMARVRGAVEEPWMFLSGSLGTIVVVTESEYFHEAHLGRDDS
ncbi:hypothetical protein FB563_0304 [Streptomyces puniciscabiei]|uniref:Uncharacterized protein n=1 Tax=Streptomyces puniciscabiei TaxID=164348 RepID=A0A542U8K1_9ACTN|nr:hypothetical protein [Streptomyces puniciscabiei]TQK95411.1 hypothetical protein FB563_0304 [Streptomyces puniciscabiei]